MQIDDRRKCKSRKSVNQMEFGTVFFNGQYFFLVTDEGMGEGYGYNEENNTVLCVNLSDGTLVPICEDDQYEVVKAKVVIE